MSDIRRIWISPYTLSARRSLGSHSPARTREGSLLKVAFENGSLGYADLHPWVEFGDEPLAVQLKMLGAGSLTPLSSRSVELARLDSQFRALGESAFEGLSVPNSHFLFTEASLLTSDIASDAEADGFTVMKVKAGKNLLGERKALESVFGPESASKLKLRLDFNSSLDQKTVTDWLLSLSAQVRSRIEFCEDPCAFDANAWKEIRKRTEIDLYCDLESETLFANDASGIRGLVLKPARQNPSQLQSKTYALVITSYLDHPLGQMGASFEAARLNQIRDVSVCGLLSHVAYEPTAYSERLPARGPVLLPNLDEVGLGFGDLLEAEDWKEL